MMVCGSRPDDPGLFQSLDAVYHNLLCRKREAGRYSVGIYLGCVETFRFEKDLVPVFFRKAHHLVFNGGTVSRADSLNHSTVHGGLINILTDSIMCFFVCVSYVAGELRQSIVTL